MTVKSMNDFDVFPVEPAVKKRGGATDRSGFCRVRVNNIGLFDGNAAVNLP
jgi:hypothetical protein